MVSYGKLWVLANLTVFVAPYGGREGLGGSYLRGVSKNDEDHTHKICNSYTSIVTLCQPRGQESRVESSQNM